MMESMIGAIQIISRRLRRQYAASGALRIALFVKKLHWRENRHSTFNCRRTLLSSLFLVYSNILFVWHSRLVINFSQCFAPRYTGPMLICHQPYQGQGQVVRVKRGLAVGAALQTGFSTDRKPATLNPSMPRRRKSGDESPHSKKGDYVVRLDPCRTRRCQTQDIRRMTQGSGLKAHNPCW